MRTSVFFIILVIILVLAKIQTGSAQDLPEHRSAPVLPVRKTQEIVSPKVRIASVLFPQASRRSRYDTAVCVLGASCVE